MDKQTKLESWNAQLAMFMKGVVPYLPIIGVLVIGLYVVSMVVQPIFLGLSETGDWWEKLRSTWADWQALNAGVFALVGGASVLWVSREEKLRLQRAGLVSAFEETLSALSSVITNIRADTAGDGVLLSWLGVTPDDTIAEVRRAYKKAGCLGAAKTWDALTGSIRMVQRYHTKAEGAELRFHRMGAANVVGQDDEIVPAMNAFQELLRQAEALSDWCRTMEASDVITDFAHRDVPYAIIVHGAQPRR